MPDKDGRMGVYTLPAYAGWSNQQITKNCGILPYLFHTRYGFRAVMAGARVDRDYPNTAKVPGMEMDFLADGSLSAKLRYIEEHAGAMDLFILHGCFIDEYAALVRRYRALRPDGKIYWELDANSYHIDRIGRGGDDLACLIEESDVIGASCRKIQRHIGKKWPCVVEYIPNGFYDFFDGRVADFSRKEDIILTVGRIGANQKFSPMLLEAFGRAADDMPGWSLRLVGRIEPGFMDYVKKYFARNPGLIKRVTLTGEISDKAALADEYTRAKVFALTSTFEGGTPNVIAEALHFGCYIVTSDIDAAEDATDGGRAGATFPLMDIDSLVRIFRELAHDDVRLSAGGRHAARYAASTFDFEKCAVRLHYLLYGK